MTENGSDRFKAKRRGEFEEWPAVHRIIMGGLLLFMFLQGAWIVSGFGAVHILILLILWAGSFPVIHYSLCRKCRNCGRKCAIPGEGDLAHLFFKKNEGPPGAINWLGTALCYLIRLGYPAAFLILYPENYSALATVIYILTPVVFLFLDSRVIGCPNCLNLRCPLNPGYRAGSV